MPARLLSDDVVGYVLYHGERLTALALLSAAEAGVNWIGTVAAAQRQGPAALATQLTTNAGFERGAKVVTFQASRFGKPVY